MPTYHSSRESATSTPAGKKTSRRIIKPYRDKEPVDNLPRETEVISIINQKGGVGKTTTAVNLAFLLGAMGKQVLLVDLDPQGNATSGLGIEKRDLDVCVYDVLLNDLPVAKAVLPDIAPGLDLLPATINLAGAEVELVSAMARESRFRDALAPMRGRYDYIFVDCPPSLGLLTVNGLVAADSLLIPIQSEFYALEGVTKLLESMNLVKTRLNRGLDIFGVLVTMYDGRTLLSKQVLQEVRDYFGDDVFQTVIPRTVKLSEAPSYGLSIEEYEPSGKGAQAYRALAQEVIDRG
jgi:chromosome partitioning protein